MPPEACEENTGLPLVGRECHGEDGSETLLLSCAEVGRENVSRETKVSAEKSHKLPKNCFPIKGQAYE